jgi:hypothetical protein
MSDYQYHIFISYRRSDENWVRWTRENFARPLRSLLRPALGKVEIFVDEQIETGESWPARLATALAHSRLLIPVLSREYFQSNWCRLEFETMSRREQEHGFRTANKPEGLILPAVIDDGDSFPTHVRAMQRKEFHDFANPFMLPDSAKQESLAEYIRKWCPSIELALSCVPPFQSGWIVQVYELFEERFRMDAQIQTSLPRLSPVAMP